jgi:signal recognition particle subunit SRP54
MRAVTGKPIKLMGVGEKIDALEDFHPARIANRILGMGDIVSLVEKAAETIDRDKALAIAEKMRKGRFDLVDLREQLTQMSKLGGLGGIMGMIPGIAKMKDQIAKAGLDDRMVKRQLAIIDSMTPRERANPEILKASRKRRIAAGSGTTPEHINRLLKMHRQMADMMKMMGRGKGGMMGKMASMFGMGGGDPLAGLDLSALTPEQLETIKRELGGQLPPGFPGALASGAGAPAGTAPSPILPASFPGGLAGGRPSGLPGLGGAKLPGLGGGFPGLPGGLNPFGGKKK